MDERLGVETLLSAMEHGASVRTHTNATRLVLDGAQVRGVELVDAITGDRSVAEARLVVNATGPWVDGLLKDLPGRTAPMAGGSKGTHLIVDPFPGAPHHALYYEAKRDGRPVLVIPWRDRWLIGSTDVRVEGSIDDVTADEAELDYIIGETNALIPSAGLTRESIRFAYTGVRPLPYATGDVGKVTRRHIVHDHAPAVEGLLTIIGGKLTTFRSLGEDATDRICRKLGVKRRSVSRHEPLPGGRMADFDRFRAGFIERSRLPATVSGRLADLYGVRASQIEDMAARDPALGTVVDPSAGVIGAEIAHAVTREFARTLTDVLMRRTMTGLEADVEPATLERVADVMAQAAGWDTARRQREIDAFLALARRHRPGVSLTEPQLVG